MSMAAAIGAATTRRGQLSWPASSPEPISLFDAAQAVLPGLERRRIWGCPVHSLPPTESERR